MGAGKSGNFGNTKGSSLDALSNLLTVASLIPGLDTFTDLASIPVDLARGDLLSAGLDAVGIIPFVGEVADTAKLAKTADKAFYSRQTASTDHDTRLFREYTQLTPNEKMSCMSETQTRDIFAETIKQEQGAAELEKMLSVPDITYTTETGETVAIEVITENYNEQRIEMKINYCQTVNIELRTVRV